VMWVVEFLTAGFLLSFSLFSLSSLGFIIAIATFYNSPSICFSLGFDYYSFNYYIFLFEFIYRIVFFFFFSDFILRHHFFILDLIFIFLTVIYFIWDNF
jgi:hypothetical protein